MPDPTAGQEPGSRPQTPASTTGPDRATQVAPPPTGPVTAARQLLPDNPVLVALGAGVLVLAGVIDWPVAAAAGLGHLVLHRWHRPAPTGESGSTGEPPQHHPWPFSGRPSGAGASR